MFSPLLPAHILKDAPGGFVGGLTGGVPVSAGPYRVDSVDRGTGLVSMLRNDKFWGPQPGPGGVVLRVGTGTELVSALKRGDIQALFVRPDTATASQLAQTVPVDRQVTVPVRVTAALAFRTSAGPTSSAAVRRAVAAGLSRELLANVLTGGRGATLLAVTSMVRMPAESGIGNDAGGDPGGETGSDVGAVFGDPVAAERELTAAGYRLTGLYQSKNGLPLRLTLGFAATDPRLAKTASSIQQQLGGIGIEVDLLAVTPGQVRAALSAGAVDFALLELPRGSSDAIWVASTFGCPRPAAVQASNPTGYCSTFAQAALTSALSGGAAMDVLGRTLWTDLPIVPLGQPTAVFAVDSALAAVTRRSGPGWLWTGPISGIANWPTS